MPETDTLKDCPFCKSPDGYVKSREHPKGFGGYERAWFVFCPSCGCEGPWTKSGPGAIHAWNRRGEPVLKPCPFCGGKATYGAVCGGESHAYAGCGSCKVFFKTPTQAPEKPGGMSKFAIEGWNRRVAPAGEPSPSSPAATAGDPAGSEGGAA